MNPLSAVYGRVAGLRRQWYQRHPRARRRLEHPVVSVGNLVVGGSGKTPVVSALAARLLRSGERPAILSRGYGRRIGNGQPIVVSDGLRVLEPVERSGDEPQMLARQLSGVPVLVAAERYQAGRLAERRFGSTVLLLDDGFQHVQLERDVDLLIASAADLDERILPAGRLREGLAAATAAHALLVPGSREEAALLSSRLGVGCVFTVEPRYDVPRLAAPFGAPFPLPVDRRIVAVAGIARPERFFTALREQGWDVAETLVFRDHHWFSSRDLDRAAAAARRAGASLVMTTEKDAVRMSDRPASLPWAFLPLRVHIEPADTFAAWMAERLAAARLAEHRHGAATHAGGEARR